MEQKTVVTDQMKSLKPVQHSNVLRASSNATTQGAFPRPTSATGTETAWTSPMRGWTVNAMMSKLLVEKM